MAHTITIKLQKPAREFAAGDSVGFGIQGGVRYYDRQAGQQKWTNYRAAIFAKQGAQADYYRSVLIEGAIVEVFGESIKADIYNGQNGAVVTLELLNAKTGFIDAGPNAGKHQPQNSGSYSNQQNNGPSTQAMDFDDDIPF